MKLVISKQYQTSLKKAIIDLSNLLPQLDVTSFSKNEIIDLSLAEFYQMV
ncbi:hypothetical protein [Streptococcus mutans]|nr:hypothetical protein [Streptococcus mutans]EMC39660.1 hypothetical protein SMU94_03227 [Streptococcus mutans 66-2A]MCB5067123.1 hypothetical protein [Streptococcus mutans]MCB5116400.1 hypothetical protein [Streptococcus mutans]MDW5543920.1 hypothetical protein [Streptococcus mutans]MDW5547524.1 hypothetical protein [Streptococcus mutans]